MSSHIQGTHYGSQILYMSSHIQGTHYGPQILYKVRLNGSGDIPSVLVENLCTGSAAAKFVNASFWFWATQTALQTRDTFGIQDEIATASSMGAKTMMNRTDGRWKSRNESLVEFELQGSISGGAPPHHRLGTDLDACMCSTGISSEK
eukprot:1185414-Prorocentrum_minimum.AAC.1